MSVASSFLKVAMGVSMTMLLHGAASAQEGVRTPSAKNSYAALEALPDWGGIWTLDFAKLFAGGPPPPPQLKGEYLKSYQAYQREVKEKNGLVARAGSNCLPSGMPMMMQIPQYPMEFLFTPGRVTTHHEAWGQWRTIFTDGRGHPDYLEPSFNGHSIGHWEGSTLVVDTVGVKTSVNLGQGIKHSDKMHIVEHIALDKADPNVLVVQLTVDDADALVKPWSTTLNYVRQRDAELIEFVCAENDRNPVDESGNTGFKRTE